MSEKVVILGASDKKDRYSYKALTLLKEYGHTPIPVHPTLDEIEGYPCYKDLLEVKNQIKKIDTVTVYVNEKISTSMMAQFLSLGPKRVIFNPGAENPILAEKLINEGIIVEEACTLVLLRTEGF